MDGEFALFASLFHSNKWRCLENLVFVRRNKQTSAHTFHPHPHAFLSLHSPRKVYITFDCVNLLVTKSAFTFCVKTHRRKKSRPHFQSAPALHSYSAYSAASSGFSTAAIAAFCIGIRQFLLLPNSTITVSSVISMIVP